MDRYQYTRLNQAELSDMIINKFIDGDVLDGIVDTVHYCQGAGKKVAYDLVIKTIYEHLVKSEQS